MPETSNSPSTGAGRPAPASFFAAATALAAIDDAVRAAHATGVAPGPDLQNGPNPQDGAGLQDGPDPQDGPEQALAALLLLRELRTQLAGWEAGLVETARAAGATWAELADPMGVASRQAAENRYLRLKPATTATGTAAERVKAVRDRRAAARTVTVWARDNAADLRVLAAQISGLTDLTPRARRAQAALTDALGGPDAADLIAPLQAVRPHLGSGHADLATRLDALIRHTEQLRHDSNRRRA